MKLDKNSSEMIKMLRFPLIVGVLFIHGDDTEVGFSTGSMVVDQSSFISVFIRNLISKGISTISVPLYFLMSGYLFALGINWSWVKYKEKLSSRFRTLLVPFICWNVLTLLLFAVAQYLPATQVYFSGKNLPISSYGLYDFFNAILGIDSYPILGPYWFIRDLMVMVLLAPITLLILKMAPKLFLGVIFMMWFLKLWPVYIPASEAFLFFHLGAFLAIFSHSLFKFDKYPGAMLSFYALFLFADVLTIGNELNGYIHRTGLLFGVASSLYVTKLAFDKEKVRSVLIWLSTFSFFIYTTHNPLLLITQKIIYKIISPNTDIIILTLYFLAPLIVIAQTLLLYVVLKSLIPKPLKILLGGR